MDASSPAPWRGLSRRDFLADCALAAAFVLAPGAGAAAMERGRRLFPAQLPERQWRRFAAAGFAAPVAGAIFSAQRPPCCGVPLGGLDTGCIDIDARGAYGFNSIFNAWSDCPAVKSWRMLRKRQGMQPILALATGGKTWVLSTPNIVAGGVMTVCQDPFFGHPAARVNRLELPAIPGVSAARQIRYWGHYPVADLEFDTDAPVGVGLRAWSPFLPGDAAASNIPAAIFEVHLRNEGGSERQGTVAFNFPGPDAQEARSRRFRRQEIAGDLRGLHVISAGGVGYALAVLGAEHVRWGTDLQAGDWQRIAAGLPSPPAAAAGDYSYADGGASAAVDFSLAPGEEKAVRFLLAWYAPVWKGAEKRRIAVLEPYHAGKERNAWASSDSESENYYTHMYASRYRDALEVARRMAADHAELLRRVLAWQEVIYNEASLPEWLRDSLINNLCLIPECSLWAQPKPPLGAWAIPGGALGMIESPRGDSDLNVIPCDWYGNLPIVFFFPEQARTTLRSYRELQRKEDGAIPMEVGMLGELPDFVTPLYDWQISLNGTCWVDLVDRLWQRTGDDSVLREFYDSVKRCNTMTMNLRPGPGGVISMPAGNKGMEWFEHGEWAGMCAHMGGLHLAQLRMMRRMAERIGDQEYARRCDAWLADGARAMEDQMWAGGYYLNFWEPSTGKRSDDVMAYQLDGQWAARFHGLPGVFRADRVQATLATIRRCNIALTPDIGAANFARPDGSALPDRSPVASGYGKYAMFPAEVLVLAMTYIEAGQGKTGLELARRHWEDLVCRQGHGWDMPNVVRGDTGARVYGTDYYQSMMLWALPAALAGQDLRTFCQPGNLVARVIEAARA